LANVAAGKRLTSWEGKAISDCYLCKWARSWIGPQADSAGDCLVEKSNIWERSHSNEAELWAREPDPDRLKNARAIEISDPKASFRTYLDLAQNGSVGAMLSVAWHYGFGQGAAVERDFSLAAEWYIRAIAAESWMATRYYAQLLANYRYFADCEKVLNDGIEKNWPPAFFWMAWYRQKQSRSRKTYREIKPLLEYAAGQGHPQAQLWLARLMVTGKFGFSQIPHGIKLFREQIAICVAEMKAREKRGSSEQMQSEAAAA
jgi:TPR repeat protein